MPPQSNDQPYPEWLRSGQPRAPHGGEPGAAASPSRLARRGTPRRSLLRYPGSVLVEVLDPIAPGLGAREFLARLQDALEPATARLVQESEMRHQGQGSGKSGTAAAGS